MAVQVGSLKIRGTIAGICFYRMYGRYYARKKSSLTGKRVKRDPVFAKTMYYAGLLGKASQIASKRYKQMVPKEERSRKKYRELVGKVMLELREEKFLSKRTRGVRKYTGGMLSNTGRGHELHKFAPINIVATETRSCKEEKVGHELHRFARMGIVRNGRDLHGLLRYRTTWSGNEIIICPLIFV
ncbi:MAG: hypothetical protein HEQ40_00855 [Lacibacter sp.]|jgi:hypothetical protein